MAQFRICLNTLLLSMLAGFAQAQTAVPPEWQTHYEASGFVETPRYEPTIAYCRRLAAHSEFVEYRSYGTSPEGRELPMLVINRHQRFDPAAVREMGDAVVLLLSCIHAGESDGKDASLMLVRDMVVTRQLEGLMQGVTLLVLPIFNVDGHERFSPYRRINQNGPVEMGYRATSQYLNLNRDFLKADAPEMRAWLRLFRRWLPDFLVDNHVTDGTDHQYPLTYGIAKRQTVAEPLRNWTETVMEPYLSEKMAAGGMPVFPYFEQARRPDLKKGVVHFPFSPRYSTGYGAVQNRIFYLVETHALKDYRTRVTANYHLLRHVLELLVRRGGELQRVNAEADRRSAEELAGSILPLNLEPDRSDSTMVDFAGYEYTIEHSGLSGGPWVRFSEQPRNYRLPYFDQTRVTDSVRVPYAYLIPQQWREQIELLQRHGVRIDTLEKDLVLEVERYRFDSVNWRPRPFEGRHMVEFEEETVVETGRFPSGTIVVHLDQRLNRLIVNLLEPRAPDSMLRWGFWNTIFERKEYAEDYVLESLAREMMQADPGLKAQYEAAFEPDSTQSISHWARLYYFYRLSPYWESHINIYPVARVMRADLRQR